MTGIDLGALFARIVVDVGEAIKDLRSFGDETNKAEGKTKNLLGSLKKLAAGFAIGVAVKKAADGLVHCAEKANELQQAYNTLQTQTGATDEEMNGLEETLKNIYANNYGESFEDIAQSLSEVKNQTNLTDEALQTATESAIALRDTFGFEVAESSRTADMMMKQFNITAEEAFNLIAQGAQSGLDKNGNLLDSINEYSVHFEQLGFNAEEMFNMLANGAESGVFDIDKLGDAVKEFGIRAKDGSDTTIAAFELLGLNADEMQQKFAEGGDSAQDAFQQVITALSNTNDEVVKNTVGVNLFGTMWEDMGAAAVLALTNTNGEISATNDSLNKIKEIKYDDVGAAFEGIKKQLETGLIIPIGEKLLPVLNNFANFIYEHMPQIQLVFETVFSAVEYLIIFISELFSLFTESTMEIWEVWGEDITKTVETHFEYMKNFIINIMGAIKGIIKFVTGVITGDWEKAFEGLKEVAENIFQAIGNLIGMAVNGIVLTVRGIGSSLYNAGKYIFESLLNGIKNKWQSISNWVSDKVGWISDKINGAIDRVSTAGSHRTGLSEVPYDGYIAELHRGEMVLTQAEAQRYKKDGNSGNSESKVYNITFSPIVRVGSVRNDKDIKEINRALDKNIREFERAIGVTG